MDERAFVERRRPEWVRLAEVLNRASSGNLHRLSREELLDIGKLYRRVTSDLSYVNANSANQDLIVYLNDLAGRAHGYLYADAPRNVGRSIMRFILQGFPILFRANARIIGLATAVFLLAVILAAGLVAANPGTFAKLVPAQFATSGSPDDGRNIGPDEESGVPIPATFASGIMVNNIFVSVRAFAGGITFGVWTVRELVQNGLMIGALAVRFSQTPALALRFWSLVLPHGFIELMAIMIAGGAGLMLGWGLISPKNLSRRDALRKSARDAVPLMAGVAGMLVVAGCIEGFITPAPLSPWFKIGFSGLTAVGLILYFGLVGRGQREAMSDEQRDGRRFPSHRSLLIASPGQSTYRLEQERAAFPCL